MGYIYDGVDFDFPLQTPLLDSGGPHELIYLDEGATTFFLDETSTLGKLDSYNIGLYQFAGGMMYHTDNELTNIFPDGTKYYTIGTGDYKFLMNNRDYPKAGWYAAYPMYSIYPNFLTDGDARDPYYYKFYQFEGPVGTPDYSILYPLDGLNATLYQELTVWDRAYINQAWYYPLRLRRNKTESTVNVMISGYTVYSGTDTEDILIYLAYYPKQTYTVSVTLKTATRSRMWTAGLFPIASPIWCYHGIYPQPHPYLFAGYRGLLGLLMKVHTPIVYPSPSIHIAGTVSEKKVWSVNYVMDIPSISISGVTVSIDRSEETRVDNNDD